MLQTFLKNNLIVLTDDGQIEKLKKTVVELSKKIKKDKPRIYSFTLAGIDPNISADNPEIVEVKNIFSDKTWQTYTSVTRDTPVPYIRAVILQTLLELSEDMVIANLINLCSKDVVSIFSYSSNEEKSIKHFLSLIEDKLIPEAEKNFRVSHKIRIALNADGSRKLIIDEAATSKSLEAAPGDGTVATFVPKVVKSYVAAVNKSHNDTTGNLQIASDAINALGLKTELIWWKTAAYSSSLRKPYKKINPALMEIIVAKDYADIVPDLFPESVNYFLSATYKEIAGDNNTIRIADFLQSITDNATLVKPLLNSPPVTEGRVSLLSFITGMVNGEYKATDFEHKVGVKTTQEVSPAILTTWLFHDFQCNKIVAAK